MKSLTALLSLLFVILSAASCASKKAPENRAPDSGRDSAIRPFEGGSGTVQQDSAVREAPRYPWEVWPFSSDLQGVPLKNAAILRADDLVRYGDRVKALAAYQTQTKKPAVQLLSANEKEALYLRIASTQLSLGQSEATLVTLSRYFRSQNLDVEQVDARFSLLFAYAYARHRDVAQSLAWFSRLNRLASDRGIPGFSAVPGAASRGVRLLLRSIPAGQLDDIAPEWENDMFVRVLIGEEHRRRNIGGGSEPSSDEFERLISLELGQGGSLAERPLSIAEGKPLTIGVLLPLSGKFTALGESLRHGFEMAIEGWSGAHQESPQQIPQVEFVDATEDGLSAVAQARDLVTMKGAQILVGPLISEHSVAVSDVARELHVPMLSFSKSGTFLTGGEIFRLGTTVVGQVESLMESATTILGIEKFALVYPQDAGGEEFAEAFRAQAHARNVTVVLEAPYQRGDPNALLAIAQELEASEAQGIFLADGLLAASRFIGSFPASSRERLRFLGPLSWDDEAQLARSQAAVDGAIYVTPFYRNSTRDDVVRFVEGYTARYGRKPDFLAAQGFDAGTLLLAAADRAHREGSSFADALRALDSYQGLTGVITPTAEGELRRSYTVVRFISGRPVDVQSLSAIGALARPASVDASSYTYHGNERVDGDAVVLRKP